MILGTKINTGILHKFFADQLWKQFTSEAEVAISCECNH